MHSNQTNSCNGFGTTVNTTYVLNKLISCNKCGCLFRPDIKPPSGHSNVHS